jgi:tetratricopeptide (TPR) repeat protein
MKHILIVGGRREDRVRAAGAREAEFPGRTTTTLDAATLPFIRIDRIELPGPAPRILRIDDLELAFPNAQTSGIRLVLTQATYVGQALIDRLSPDDLVIATGNRAVLERDAPELLAGRGVWRHFGVMAPSTAEADAPQVQRSSGSTVPLMSLLRRAFESRSPHERAELCRQATALGAGSEVAALSLASACRELQDTGARDALDTALRLAPDWAAAHFEDGKFWLAADDLVRARDAFARAAELMPTFSAAFSNLGATRGELDDPDGAAEAFARALAHDPDNYTILNNIGVLERERGRLDASEEALGRVTRIAPEFVFGHYNLGHTRFLRGDYAGALEAYEAGRSRDTQQNRRQGCRLALVRFATGDRQGAEREFWPLIEGAPADEREDLLLEAYEIGCALLQADPRLAPDRAFVERIAAAVTV